MSRLTLLFCLLYSSLSFGQQKYWVYFNERDLISHPVISPKTVENRRMLGLEVNQVTDFGPKKQSLDVLKKLNIETVNISRWFNAVSAYLTPTQANSLRILPEIKSIEPISIGYLSYNSESNKSIKIENFQAPFAITQMNGQELIRGGFLAQNVDVGIIDGGFFEAPDNYLLKHIFDKKKVKAYRDFLYPNKIDFFNTKESDGDFHGTAVWQLIAGKDSSRSLYTGLASEANFYLARTESGKQEARIEEDSWIAAIEWLDSLGVRLANSSLGYTMGFTNPAESYSPDQMDGKTTVIAKGAQIAVKEKGMILVVAAGNEGENKKWGGIVASPGDVEEVISVGANDKQGLKMGYSSKGNPAVSFVKPDVTAYSEFGTSLSAPVITGLAAALLGIKPDLTSDELKIILKSSGILSGVPNTYIGAGYPDVIQIANVFSGDYKPKAVVNIEGVAEVNLSEHFSEEVLIFHKISGKVVVDQNYREKPQKNAFLKRPKDIKYTTLIGKNKIVEVRWKTE